MSYTDKEKLELINDNAFGFLVKYKNTKKEEEGLLTIISMLEDIKTTSNIEEFAKFLVINSKNQFPVSTKITIEANGDSVEISNTTDAASLNSIKKLLNRQIDIKHEICKHYLKLFIEEV